jgi:outer membrane protein assembly factor BamE (lipoprotein component of BamABCDE complex)
MNRHYFTDSALMLIFGAVVALVILCSGCSTIRRAERQYNNNERVRELLESYYITKENPENNQPGEQDSIKQLLKHIIR